MGTRQSIEPVDQRQVPSTGLSVYPLAPRNGASLLDSAPLLEVDPPPRRSRQHLKRPLLLWVNIAPIHLDLEQF
jgi:hypothetical protein